MVCSCSGSGPRSGGVGREISRSPARFCRPPLREDSAVATPPSAFRAKCRRSASLRMWLPAPGFRALVHLLRAAAASCGAVPCSKGRVAPSSVNDVKEALQCKHLIYDRAGEEHYNIISAVHKSMRGSDPDAALYWLARMLEGGENPLYIARRLIRFASEDVGLADPLALTQAVACYQACHFLGMPECNVHLAQCVAYLSLAPKSVAVYEAIEAAQRLVRERGQNDPVPLHLRNAPTKLMKELGYGKGYMYPPSHSNPVRQEYLPTSLAGYKFLDWPDEKISK